MQVPSGGDAAERTSRPRLARRNWTDGQLVGREIDEMWMLTLPRPKSCWMAAHAYSRRVRLLARMETCAPSGAAAVAMASLMSLYP
jgi:hypothetical protein